MSRIILAVVVVATVAIGALTPYSGRSESREQIEKIERAKAAVKAVLTDPYSAQFESVREVDMGPTDGRVVCGFVNAKNRMGGYVGRTPFFINKGKAYLLTDDLIAVVGDPIMKNCFPTIGLH